MVICSEAYTYVDQEKVRYLLNCSLKCFQYIFIQKTNQLLRNKSINRQQYENVRLYNHWSEGQLKF